jgi:hypothetical protein
LRVAACGSGLPFDVAFAAEDDFVKAWIVAKGENEGGEFNWTLMKWMEK